MIFQISKQCSKCELKYISALDQVRKLKLGSRHAPSNYVNRNVKFKKN